MISPSPIAIALPAKRHSRQSKVVWGSRVVTVGGGAPVRVQSMTNTDTVDVIGTAIQVKELAIAGSEMVRITVNTPEAAAQFKKAGLKPGGVNGTYFQPFPFAHPSTLAGGGYATRGTPPCKGNRGNTPVVRGYSP